MDRTVPPGAARLLDFIGLTEAPNGYGTIYANKQGKLPKPLTSMTLDEVLAAQKGWSKNHGSSAAGRYQFMRATLVGLIAELGLRGSQKLKPIVESMGMDWSAQYRRVTRDPILKEGIAIMATPFGRGGDQEAVCLKFDLVNGWLFTIDSARIKDEAVREKVILYQRECHGVLFRHFYKGAKQTSEPLVIEDHEETANPDTSKVRLVTECRQTFGAKASGQLWFQLGLPTVPAMIEQSRQFDLLDYSAIKTKPETPTANAA